MNARLRVLIVDDEALARDRLTLLLSDIAESLPNEVVGKAADGLSALEILAQTPVDVALLDIRMPRMGGLELASHLQRCEPVPAVIFATAYEQHAVQAFELNAVDYLLKPIRAERLLTALQKVLVRRNQRDNIVAQENLKAMMNEPRRFFSCIERGKLLLVPVTDVLVLQADAKYVTARTVERDYLLDESLLKLEEEFSEHFLRLHRSTLVAKSALVGFEKEAGEDGEHWMALLRGLSCRLPVSRRQWPLVKKYARAAGD